MAKNRWPTFKLQSQSYNRAREELSCLLRRTLKTQLYWHSPQDKFLWSQGPQTLCAKSFETYKKKVQGKGRGQCGSIWPLCGVQRIPLRARVQITPTRQLVPILWNLGIQRNQFVFLEKKRRKKISHSKGHLDAWIELSDGSDHSGDGQPSWGNFKRKLARQSMIRCIWVGDRRWVQYNTDTPTTPTNPSSCPSNELFCSYFFHQNLLVP